MFFAYYLTHNVKPIKLFTYSDSDSDSDITIYKNLDFDERDLEFLRIFIMFSAVGTIKQRSVPSIYDAKGPFILGEKYPLYCIEIIKKFNVNLSGIKLMNLIDNSSKLNKLDIIEYFYKKNRSLEYSNKALDWASQKGHINVLEWWFNSGLPLKYSEDALQYSLCSRESHINILEWWKNSGLPLKYSENALKWASQDGQVDTLEWWKNSKLPLKYSEEVLDYAYFNVLEWWENSGLLQKL